MGSRCCYLLLVLLLGLLRVELGVSDLQASENPFSPRASLLRYWNRLFSSYQIPEILLSKSSPLNASQVAAFSRYIDENALPDRIRSFCSSANLFCDLKVPPNVTRDVSGDADFESYSNKQFKRYQNGGVFGGDTFKNYSVGENVARDMFLRYGKDGNGVSEDFRNYAVNTNVAGSGFANYASNGNGESGSFQSYGPGSNVQGHDFATYGSEASGSSQDFRSYSDQSNVVRNGFKTYGSESNGMSNTFASYSTSSNIATNKFKSYGDGGNGLTDSFNNYGDSTNIPRNDFESYDNNGNAGSKQFSSYGEGSSQSQNEFRTYGEGTNEPSETFKLYGNSTSPSKNEFVEYGKDANAVSDMDFAVYVGNETTFKEYFRSKANFLQYVNSTERTPAAVEPGKFFRQENLAAGKQIPMPDIRDKMPPRSFLPRVLADKLPFSSARLPELVGTLGAADMKGLMAKTISECERPPVKDETKRCVTSVEGMADFATSVLGKTAAVSTTASTAGWGKTLVVGKVAGRHGGEETRSVSCHQSLFPYLVYYCHAVPRVKVYDVELMEEGGKVVNQGVAICHLDTTQWSATHAAFAALGPGPGKIEVCHWIFENDLVWVARG